MSHHLTFDVDWAPDWSVRDVLRTLAEHDERATFFVTHASDTIAEIRDAGHEVGIHPNFQVGSTQGGSPSDIVGSLLDIVPDARAIRTHGLIQGSLLFRDVLSAFPQLQYDLSLITYRFPHSGWFDWRLGGASMRRLNYTWEDDFAFEDPRHDWGIYHAVPLDVLDFHPIHVSMNAQDARAYEQAKSRLGGRPLTELSRADAQNDGVGPGTADYLRAVLTSGDAALSFEELLCVSA